MLTERRSAPFSQGFTLIELLITVTIAAILAAVALPSFAEFIERGQVRAAAESIQNALQLARGEAVRRNELITFTLGSGSGATSWDIQDSVGAEIQRSRASGEGSAVVTATRLPATATAVTFNGFGRVPTGGTPLNQILVRSAGTTLTSRIEIMTPGGQIRLCDPSVSTAGDPRRCQL